MISSELKILSNQVGVPIQELSTGTIKLIEDAPQAQKRTAIFKKAVKIVDSLVFKGPYKSDEPRLMHNLRFTHAIQLLENVLHLPEWQRGALSWKYIGQSDSDRYYLVAPNVGKYIGIPRELKSSKIETDVPIIPRGGAVWRVSDIEKHGRLNGGIKLAALQHLYFRFLFDIGDSGTHNILIREDKDTAGRLIAGVDLEEKRAIKDKGSRLDHLFKKAPSKTQTSLYAKDVDKIKAMANHHIHQQVLDSLGAIGIDLRRLKENIEIWNRLT